MSHTGQFEKISTDFSSNWKSALGNMYTTVTTSFPNLKTGTQVLHNVYGQLIVYYTKFFSLLEQQFGKNVPFKHQPVAVQALMVEVRKYRGTSV